MFFSAAVAMILASTAPALAEGPGDGLTFGMVSVTNCGNPTICAVQRGFQAEIEASGAKAIVLEWSGQGSPVDAAITNMDQLIAQGVDAIALWPIDSGALQAPTRRAFEAGIPVFAFDDFDTTQDGVIALITQGRELQAKQAAGVFCKAFPDGGQVLYGDYGLPIPALQFLAKSFAGHLETCSGGKLTIAATYLNKTDDVAGARTSAEPALLANPDVVGITSYNDPTSLGASQAADALGMRDKVMVLGYNLAPDGVDALTAGRLDMSWDFQPVLGGQLLARTALDYVTGVQKSPEKFIVFWPQCYSFKTVSTKPSWDDQIASIATGTSLEALAPVFVTRGADVPAPGADLPDCPAE